MAEAHWQYAPCRAVQRRVPGSRPDAIVLCADSTIWVGLCKVPLAFRAQGTLPRGPLVIVQSNAGSRLRPASDEIVGAGAPQSGCSPRCSPREYLSPAGRPVGVSVGISVGISVGGRGGGRGGGLQVRMAPESPMKTVEAPMTWAREVQGQAAFLALHLPQRLTVAIKRVFLWRGSGGVRERAAAGRSRVRRRRLFSTRGGADSCDDGRYEVLFLVTAHEPAEQNLADARSHGALTRRSAFARRAGVRAGAFSRQRRGADRALSLSLSLSRARALCLCLCLSGGRGEPVRTRTTLHRPRRRAPRSPSASRP